MRRRALDSLRSAIEANTERRSIEQLQAQGKRHVRVVSGEKVMQIITAIVNDIVEREVGETTQRDRDRIVSETKSQFDRVMQMQAETDRLIREQKELAAQYRERLEASVQDGQRLKARIEELRAEQVARESKLLGEYQARVQELAGKARDTSEEARQVEEERRRLERQLADEREAGREREARFKAEFEERARELEREQQHLVQRFEGERGELAGRQEQALAGARDRIAELQDALSESGEARGRADQRCRDLEADLDAARTAAGTAAERAKKAERIIHKLDTRLERARAALENYDRELQRLIAERDQLAADLAAARERAGESDAVSQLRTEMEDLKSFLVERTSGPSEATMETLLERLSQRESSSNLALEERFNASLDASLDKITRTMEMATARPIEIEVEATDALVSRLFDLDDDELSSNMDQLEVEVKKTKGGITGSLDALRAMRQGQAVPQEPEPAAEAEADEPEPEPVRFAAPPPPPRPAPPPAPRPAPQPAPGTPSGHAGSDSRGDHAGPAAEPASVSDEAKSKISASMERLKAVRGGEENKD